MSSEDKYITQTHVVWRVSGLTYENAEMFKYIDSEPFTIFVGLNETKWTLRIENSDCQKYIDFCMIKLSNGGDNVSVECETNVKLNNGKTKYSGIVNKSSKEFAFECKNFLPLKEIFETEPKNLSEKNTLIFDIMLTLVQQKHETREQIPKSFPYRQFFNSKKYSDFNIISSNDEFFPVHRLVIASQSSALEEFVNISLILNHKNVMKLGNIDGSTLREFLRFIYTGEIENVEEHAPSLLIIAKSYDLEDLYSLCTDVVIQNLSPNNIFDILVLAKNLSDNCMMLKCFMFIKKNHDILIGDPMWEEIDPKLFLKILDFYKKTSTDVIELANTLEVQ